MSNVDEILELLTTPDLSRLEQHLEYKDSLINSFTKQLREHEARLHGAKEIIIEAILIDRIGKNVLMNVAEALDITLTKKYDITISPIYRGTIEIPLGENIDKLLDHIEFEFSDKGEDDWDVDIFQHDIDIDYEESE
jgi:hypothetical protein